MVIAALFVYGLSSCKKNDIAQPQTTLQKIQGSWLLQNITTNDHYSGSDHNSSTPGISTDIFDFRTDGKIYYSISGYKDTVTYNLPSDTKIVIDGVNLYDIKTLTENSFIIYKKELSGSSDYSEETITWKK